MLRVSKRATQLGGQVRNTVQFDWYYEWEDKKSIRSLSDDGYTRELQEWVGGTERVWETVGGLIDIITNVTPPVHG